MSTERILVTGSTGNVGSGLVQALSKSGANVTAMVHESSKAQSLKNQGVDVIVDDLDEPKHLDDAIANVTRIYLLTTNGPNAVKQVRNVLRAAAEGGRPHIVRHSGHGSERSRIIRQHLEAEAEIRSSGLPYTMLRPTFYMQNTMMASQTVSSQGRIYMPFKDGRVGMIDVRDIADVAARVLTSSGHEGKTYILTGPESISFHDISRILSEVLGKEVKYTDVPYEAGRKSMLSMGVPDWIADGYMELFQDFAQNWADHVTDDVEHITGRPAGSFLRFAKDFAHAFGGRGGS